MANGQKAKRTGWQPPPKPTTPPGMEVCSVCKRLFRPKPENKTGTCLNCQKGLTKAAKLLVARKKLIDPLPPEPTKKHQKLKPKKTRRICLRCLNPKGFLSDGIYNRICPGCREANANTGINPIPNNDYQMPDSHGD